VKSMLTLWFILLLPWPIALMGAGMSGEGGGHHNHVAILTLIWSVVSYPALVLVAFASRRSKPLLVFLPALSFAIGFTAGLFI